MAPLCLRREGIGPYYCIAEENHVGGHCPRNARVIIRTMEIELSKLKLSDKERDALSKAIHFRIPQLQRSIQQLEEDHPETAEYSNDQLQALFSFAARFDLP